MKKAKTKGKRVPKWGKPLTTSLSFHAKTFFLTYKGISDSGEKVTKDSLANYLLEENPNDRRVKPEKYLICEEMYDSGEPHFHVILLYPRRKSIESQAFYDYLGIHPNIQTMRNMKAALDYVYKQDSDPVTNMDIHQQKRVARAQHSSSLYEFLYEQMVKDPFNFDVYNYCIKHNIHRQIYKANYTKAVNLLKHIQIATCNNILVNKSGLKPITRTLIQAQLSPSELKTYDSWDGYQIIVNHLNTMIVQRGNRQQKTINLLITGESNTGKSALVWQRNPLPNRAAISNFCSVYPMGMSQWFPKYESDVYHCIYWNEAKLTSYSYDTILKLLDGSPLDLANKGSVSRKVDNPLIIMTSNMTLDQMIKQKFGYNKSYVSMARKNLAVRVQNVIIPENYDLFLLQKLLISNIDN